jgi:hypothetical protein
LEKKPGALDHARPLADWNLPECFSVLRRRLENERAGDGDVTSFFRATCDVSLGPKERIQYERQAVYVRR